MGVNEGPPPPPKMPEKVSSQPPLFVAYSCSPCQTRRFSVLAPPLNVTQKGAVSLRAPPFFKLGKDIFWRAMPPTATQFVWKPIPRVALGAIIV